MGTRISSSQLDESFRELMVAWDRTRDSWRDDQARAFEAQYLEKLPGLVNQARAVTDELDALLRKIRNDCDSPF